MSFDRRAWLSAAFIAVLLLGNCKTPPGPELRPPHAPRAVEVQPAIDILTANDMFPPEAGVWPYEVTAGESRGLSVDLVRMTADRFDAQWRDDLGPWRTQYWSVDEAGDVAIVAVIDHGERALTLFDPPLIMAYSQQRIGERVVDEARMRVVDPRNEQRQRAYGTAKRAITYVGDRRIETPIGELIAQEVLLEFTAELNNARVDRTSTLYVVPGMGVVAEYSDETVLILGMFGRSSEEGYIISATPDMGIEAVE